jgi:hypothetical protein
MRCNAALWITLAMVACNQTPSAHTVQTYVGHIHAGRHDQAYAMLATKTRDSLSVEDWKAGMHTEMLADATSASVSGLRTLDPGGTCVYTQLDFETHPDQGPYGYYIFYLQDDGGQLRVLDVQTYDRIEGEGLVKTGHFDETREPFPCSAGRP